MLLRKPRESSENQLTSHAKANGSSRRVAINLVPNCGQVSPRLCTAHLINAVREITHEWGSFQIRSTYKNMALRKKCFRFVSALPLEVSVVLPRRQPTDCTCCVPGSGLPLILLGYAAPGTLCASPRRRRATPHIRRQSRTSRRAKRSAKPPKRNREEHGLLNQKSKLQNVTAELNVPI